MSNDENYTQLLTLPTEELLEKFGSGGHKPGSGSAAALLSVVACKLVQNVVSLTGGRDQYKGVTDQLALVNQGLLDLEPPLLEAVERDSIQFNRVIEARRARDREKDTNARRALNSRALSELKAATEIPIEIAANSIRVAEQALLVFDLGFQSARGDSGVAISAALAGASGAVSVAYLNLTSFRGGQWAVQTRKRADELYEKVQGLQLEFATRVARLQSEVAAAEARK